MADRTGTRNIFTIDGKTTAAEVTAALSVTVAYAVIINNGATKEAISAINQNARMVLITNATDPDILQHLPEHIKTVELTEMQNSAIAKALQNTKVEIVGIWQRVTADVLAALPENVSSVRLYRGVDPEAIPYLNPRNIKIVVIDLDNVDNLYLAAIKAIPTEIDIVLDYKDPQTTYWHIPAGERPQNLERLLDICSRKITTVKQPKKTSSSCRLL